VLSEVAQGEVVENADGRKHICDDDRAFCGGVLPVV